MIVTIVCIVFLTWCVSAAVTYAIVHGGTRKEMPSPPPRENS